MDYWCRFGCLFDRCFICVFRVDNVSSIKYSMRSITITHLLLVSRLTNDAVTGDRQKLSPLRPDGNVPFPHLLIIYNAYAKQQRRERNVQITSRPVKRRFRWAYLVPVGGTTTQKPGSRSPTRIILLWDWRGRAYQWPLASQPGENSLRFDVRSSTQFPYRTLRTADDETDIPTASWVLNSRLRVEKTASENEMNESARQADDTRWSQFRKVYLGRPCRLHQSTG